MPEGPSLVILTGELQPFKGKKILPFPVTQRKILTAGTEKTIDFKLWATFLTCFKTSTAYHFGVGNSHQKKANRTVDTFAKQ